MNYISTMAPTEASARQRAATDTGYPIRDIGQLVTVLKGAGSSRQMAYVFVTSNDVTTHPSYSRMRLSQHLPKDDAQPLDDGPVLVYGPEITAGG